MTDETLVERLRIIRGTQFTPIENALVTEAADRITSLEEEKRVRDEALRWLYRNGLQHSTKRPEYVQRAFDEAFAEERTALSAGVRQND